MKITWHVAIVLDDYHLIDTPLIQNVIAKLLAYLPAHIRLILATRIEPALPLTLLQVRGQLLTLHATDLYFQGEETAIFLRKVMGLSLTEQDITTLEDRTEGWIAGLQLAALSLQRQKDLSSFITNFSGNNRSILNYLASEALENQLEAVQTFLLQTCILERFSASLCNAVTEQAYNQRMINRIYTSNLFCSHLTKGVFSTAIIIFSNSYAIISNTTFLPLCQSSINGQATGMKHKA